MAIKPVRPSQINGYIKRLITGDSLLGNISVIGEISNFKYHSSGHVYFSLKDDLSKINCFLPSNVFESLRYELGDGIEIIASGYVSVYEKGGTYSLNIRTLDIEGIGNLSIAFENLRKKLEAEGLFDKAAKKQLPFFPKKIAIVTSSTGAAIEDMLKIITSKNNVVDILVYSTLVQGSAAAEQIASAIDHINRDAPEVDVIITGRGGGSAEELWAFNEEIVARSIFASGIPVISAVGHENDFTISDFVADRRAETPTAAAMMAVPDTDDLRAQIELYKNELLVGLKRKADKLKTRLEAHDIITINHAFREKIHHSEILLEMKRMVCKHNIDGKLQETENSILGFGGRLEAMNPMKVLERGYTVLAESNGKPIVSVKSLKEGMRVSAIMKDGKAGLAVEEVMIGVSK